jgi:hypothetical protein
VRQRTPLDGSPAARDEVHAARQGLEDEVVRLEASARAAVDIPARLRREPAKVLGAAGGAAFLLLGGPKRLFRRARRAVLGPDADLPKSMLPDEVEKTLKKMGSDGDKVRGTLEKEFANTSRRRRPSGGRDLAGVAADLASLVGRPRSGPRQFAERLFVPMAIVRGGPAGCTRMERTAGSGDAAGTDPPQA